MTSSHPCTCASAQPVTITPTLYTHLFTAQLGAKPCAGGCAGAVHPVCAVPGGAGALQVRGLPDAAGRGGAAGGRRGRPLPGPRARASAAGTPRTAACTHTWVIVQNASGLPICTTGTSVWVVCTVFSCRESVACEMSTLLWQRLCHIDKRSYTSWPLCIIPVTIVTVAIVGMSLSMWLKRRQTSPVMQSSQEQCCAWLVSVAAAIPAALVVLRPRAEPRSPVSSRRRWSCAG
jgi:hypothetical protein